MDRRRAFNPARQLRTAFFSIALTGAVMLPAPGLCEDPTRSLATASPDQQPWTLNFYFENDLFGETDQNYTNGIRISWVSPDLDSFESSPALPTWINRLNDQLHFFHNLHQGLQRNLVLTVGQLIYTPETINTSELLVDERPYAGYLYTGIGYHSRSQSRLDSLEIHLGMVGPSALGQDAQDFIHDLRGFDKFQGWDNQLRDEPTLNLVYEHKLVSFRNPLWGTVEHDFIGHAGLALGTVSTYVNLGGEYRIGRDLPNDFGTSAVRPAGDNSAPGRGDPRLQAGSALIYGFHLFLAVDGRLVARDIFLDGNTWKNSHRVDKEPAVANLALGFSFLVRHWKLSYAQVFRTREFREQPSSHEYGSLSLSYSW